MLKLGYNENDREEVDERLQVRLTLKDKVRDTAVDARLQDEPEKMRVGRKCRYSSRANSLRPYKKLCADKC